VDFGHEDVCIYKKDVDLLSKENSMHPVKAK
jgi:hypothetical protein